MHVDLFLSPQTPLSDSHLPSLYFAAACVAWLPSALSGPGSSTFCPLFTFLSASLAASYHHSEIPSFLPSSEKPCSLSLMLFTSTRNALPPANFIPSASTRLISTLPLSPSSGHLPKAAFLVHSIAV